MSRVGGVAERGWVGGVAERGRAGGVVVQGPSICLHRCSPLASIKQKQFFPVCRETNGQRRVREPPGGGGEEHTHTGVWERTGNRD